MNSLNLDKEDSKKLSWHPMGHAWESPGDIVEQFSKLKDQGVEVSPLWEIEKSSVLIEDRYPATIHTPPMKKKR